MFFRKIQRKISDAQACVEIEEKWYPGHTGALTVWKRPSTHTFEKLPQFVNKDSETKIPRHSKWPSCWSLSQVFLKVQIEWSGVETKQLSAWDLKYVTVPSLLLVLLIRWRKWTLKKVTILGGASQHRPLYGVPRGPLSIRKMGGREQDEDGIYSCSQVFWIRALFRFLLCQFATERRVMKAFRDQRISSNAF